MKQTIIDCIGFLLTFAAFLGICFVVLVATGQWQ